MQTQYIIGDDGFLVGIYEGPAKLEKSTTIPPIYNEGFVPQFLNGQWVDRSKRTVTVSPVEFKLLWTPVERATITGLKASDPIVADFYSIIDDPRLTLVNLSLASTQQTVDYLLAKLVEATVLTEEQATERRAAILSGAFQ